MTRLEKPPGFLPTLFTLGIMRALWIADSNRRLGRGGAGFWFAWFLLAFAHYGIAGRLTEALRAAGSSHRVSPMACFWLTGWPFIGARKRLKRGVEALNDAYQVRDLNQPVGPPAPQG